MQKRLKISIGMLAAFMLAVFAVNIVMAGTSVGKVNAAIVPSKVTNVEATVDNGLAISPEQAADPEQLKKLVPTTLAEAEASILPVRRRFLMWTYDGVHIMWGTFGNGRFVGTDNLGKRCWGIYGRGIFAGFYDGQFFWGKYNNGAWKAQYLFGLAYSGGKYLTFPQLKPTVASVNP